MGLTSTVARRAIVLSLVALPLAAAPRVAHASPPPGNVTGTVKDSSGTPIPNATVTIATLKRVATTDGNGRFAFRGVPAGHYHVDAIFIGYARAGAEIDVPERGGDVAVAIVMHPTPLRLSNVVVTAASDHGDALDITQSTVDLSGKELARTLSSSLAVTLESEPGMATRYNGPAASMPIIRGLTGERILVLQDGERSGDLSSAASDHGVTIDPLGADRIEVVRGPASLLYGSSALGGVVNVISNDIPTSVPARVSGFLGGQTESVNPGGAVTAGVTVPLGSSVALTASGGFRSTRDVRTSGGEELFNSDSRNDHQSVGLAWVGGRGSLGVSGGRYGFRYGLPSTPVDAEAGAQIDGLRREGRVRAELNGGRLFPLFTLTGALQHYAHDEIENTGDVATSFELSTQTVNATVKSTFGRMSGALGVSGLFKQYAATGEEALTPAADSRTGGVFVYQDLPLRSTDAEHAPHLQVGARFDTYRVDSKAGAAKFGPARSRDFSSTSGSIGVTIPVGRTASLALSGARAFRAPSVEELFSNAFHAAAGTFDLGNPDLAAETNNGVDVVYRVQGGRVEGQLGAYYNRIANYIAPSIAGDTVTDEGETVPLSHFVQEDATLRGVEARMEASVLPHLVLGVMADVTRGRFADGASVPFMPAARVGGQSRWERGQLSLGAEVRHGFAQRRVSGGDVDVPTDAYTLVDLHAGWSFLQGQLVHSVTLRADNVFDERYRDATSRIKRFAYNPGRNIAVVYRVLF